MLGEAISAIGVPPPAPRRQMRARHRRYDFGGPTNYLWIKLFRSLADRICSNRIFMLVSIAEKYTKAQSDI